ncbi:MULTISPECIES: SPOR domain-containing protein [unclassified Vibrio]|uniref:SPOR domain-containing protein n=1 Tax=Vibrio sp. HB236076 TaxID=3232307 RepID=A0AB39HGX2_9VIBR|nr:SPOR domain-containing protein [Vibrio sp. HB161653]MDP5254742.1 SPOR domain-containing protein [Vibrio sp. HB161653]
MASQFQNRLVGTIILVSLGVIVIPDILDGQKQHYQEQSSAVPLKPESDGRSMADVKAPEAVDTDLPEAPVKVVTIDNTPADHDSGSSPEKKPNPVDTAAEKPLPVAIEDTEHGEKFDDSAYVIQLMALKNSENAINMVKDLQKRGYQAHTKKENGFTRVIIGPDVSKSKLEQQIIELEKITGSRGQLLKFRPINP